MKIGRKSLFAIGLAIIAVVLALYYWFNPVEASFAPKCMFKAVTGWSCSGCGMQRFLHAFMHGRFLEAIQYNYMLVLLLPYLLLYGIERFLLTGETQMRWRKVLEGRVMTISLIALAPAWLIVRNILHI